jgi:hypothetical protein
MLAYLSLDSCVVHARKVRKDEEFEARGHFLSDFPSCELSVHLVCLSMGISDGTLGVVCD